MVLARAGREDRVLAERNLMRTRRRNLVIAFVVALVAVGAFAGGRLAGPGREVAAEPPAAETVSAAPRLPQPGEVPDTSKPLWYVPYLQAEDELSRYNRVLAGIGVGPTVEMGGYDASQCVGRLLEISPRHLPEGAEIDPLATFSNDVCGDGMVRNEVTYRIPPDEADAARITRGEVNFFDAKHGGSFLIYKRFIAVPAWQNSFPSDRLRPGSINGHPAVIGEPLFPQGFGQSMILMWEADTGVLTVLTGMDIPSAEMLRIAQGVVAQ
jgi:hypothetical protein